MAPWVMGITWLAALCFLGMSAYFFFYGDSYLLRYAGLAITAFALTAAVETTGSKIELDGDTMRVGSMMRQRSFQRSEFEAAQIDRGVVVLKRKAGGWLVLPGTGRDARAVRHTIHAWITQA